MKKLLLSITLITLITACNNNFIYFGKNQKYVLANNEIVADISQVVLDDYATIILGQENIPLNKYILSKSYRTFIGVSFNDAPQTLKERFNSPELDSHEVNEQADYISMKSQIGNNHIFRYLYFSEKDQLTYLVNVCSKDADFIKQLYTDSLFVNNRIKKQ